MLLPSTLTRSTLGDVLGTLLRARATGVLTLREPGTADDDDLASMHLVQLVAGRPVAVRSGGARLGEILGEWSRARAGELERALAAAARGPRLAGEVLTARGLATQAEVQAGLAEQTRRRLDALFALRDARISFHTALFGSLGSAFRRVARTAPEAAPASFLHGRPRTRERAPRPEDARLDALRTLGLAAHADPLTVRRAYKRLVVALHPDRATSPEDLATRTRELARVTAAYHRVTSG